MDRGQLEFLEKALGMESCPLGVGSLLRQEAPSGAELAAVSLFVGHPAWTQKPWKHRDGLKGSCPEAREEGRGEVCEGLTQCLSTSS